MYKASSVIDSLFVNCKTSYMKKIFLLAFVIPVIASTTNAQDKIYRKNGKVVEAKILEVGSSEIKYRIWKDDTGPVYILETDKIKRVEFENGTVQKFVPDLRDPELYEDQLRKAVKIDFLGPLSGYTQITYERSTAVGRSIEYSLGIIGAGKSERLDYYNSNFRSTRRNPFGVAAGIGYKFNKLPDFLFGRTRFTHIMQGSYLRPVFYAGNYSENRIVFKNTSEELERRNVTFGALQLELGKQWVFGDKVVMDLYFGFGYGADNKRDDYNNGYSYNYDDTGAYNYLNARIGTSPGFSLSGALKIGLLIK